MPGQVKYITMDETNRDCKFVEGMDCSDDVFVFVLRIQEIRSGIPLEVSVRLNWKNMLM